MHKLFQSRSFYMCVAGTLIAAVLVLAYQTLYTEELPDDIEIGTVAHADVVEVISETGFVQPSREVTLAFETGGRVASIPVSEGDTVVEGAELALLDTSVKEAELAAAYAQRAAAEAGLGITQATVRSAEVALQNAKENLTEVTAQQDQLVASAKKTLLTSGLAAHFIGQERSQSHYSYEPPTITGVYSGETEGTYIIDPYRSNSVSGSSFELSGMETGIETISTETPQPLGSRGLYIQFPENFAHNADVLWEVPIPNTRSSNYLANRIAYDAAVEARDVAIQSAENALESARAALTQKKQQAGHGSVAVDERTEAQHAKIRQADAAARVIEIAIEHMKLTAPFSGIVTDIVTEAGAVISPASAAVSLISDDAFELSVYISESDIQEVDIGDTAEVTFDAYDDAVSDATVTKIAPNAKVVGGVRVFEVTLQFDEQDAHIRSGLSADIDIHAAKRADVIAVPSRAVIERADGRFVRTLRDGNTVIDIPVETGLRGSNGMTEIVRGLTAGEEIITFASQDAIRALKSK